MRSRVTTSLLTRYELIGALGGALLSSAACKAQPELAELTPSPLSAPSGLGLLSPRPSSAPLNSAVQAFERDLQAKKLTPPPRRTHAPVIAFARGVLGQLTRDSLRVFDTVDFRLLATEPLESPRALLALADGSLLAIGARTMLHWEREKKHAKSLPRPVLLPSSHVYADAQRGDRFWVVDVDGKAGDSHGPGLLQSYVLEPSEAPLPLPEQSIELTLPRGGVFGRTREGTWLYATGGRGERFSPGGLRLSGLGLGQGELPTWLLPARRLDQSLWLQDSGQVSRALVSPTYKRLAGAQLPGRAVDADVGDHGQLLAVVAVTGEGPRFELLLLDHQLGQLARLVLPSDEPTGDDDWVRVVTENQSVAVAPLERRVAVGGPGRVTIFDGEGKQLFSITSR
jgi:hypothetical protein